jgi:hypothetical protein
VTAWRAGGAHSYPVQLCATLRLLGCQLGTADDPAAQQRPRGALKAANARAGSAGSAAI